MNNYDKILCSNNPSNVNTISMLMHYCNCYGLSCKLMHHFNVNEETLCFLMSNGNGLIQLKKDKIHEAITQVKESIKQREDAERKNNELCIQLSTARDSFCNGMGTRKTKLFLNKQIKNGDNNARLYRLALEIEDKNIQAKNVYYYYKDKVYYQKHLFILELAKACKDYGVTFGVQKSDNYSANCIFFFELPNMKQISFHTNLSSDEFRNYPAYNKEWDGQINSTLPKIEETLMNIYFRS